MANSDFISETKNKILSDLQSDDLFIEVLGASEEEIEEGLVYKRLFPFFYIYDGIQTTVKTYVCVRVDIKSYSRRNDICSYPTITFDVIAHQNDMELDMAGVSKTRADYLAEIIEDKYKGSTEFGYGSLKRVANEEGSVDEIYRYRRIVFKAVDIDVSYCG